MEMLGDVSEYGSYAIMYLFASYIVGIIILLLSKGVVSLTHEVDPEVLRFFQNKIKPFNLVEVKKYGWKFVIVITIIGGITCFGLKMEINSTRDSAVKTTLANIRDEKIAGYYFDAERYFDAKRKKGNQ